MIGPARTTYAAIATPALVFTALKLSGVVGWSWWWALTLLVVAFLATALTVGVRALCRGEGTPS